MFRVLLRLYLITIVTYSAAIYLIPKLVIQLFEHRYMDYNIEQSRGLQKLISLLTGDNVMHESDLRAKINRQVLILGALA